MTWANFLSNVAVQPLNLVHVFCLNNKLLMIKLTQSDKVASNIAKKAV